MRQDDFLEKRKNQDVLEVAFPNELHYGQNYWYWSLRNSPVRFIEEGEQKRINIIQEGFGPFAKAIAARKMPEIQPIIISKAKPFNLKYQGIA